VGQMPERKLLHTNMNPAEEISHAVRYITSSRDDQANREFAKAMYDFNGAPHLVVQWHINGGHYGQFRPFL
jgi:hypothetical protein